jgi:D-alanyl-D-alanine carboxypeptidase
VLAAVPAKRWATDMMTGARQRRTRRVRKFQARLALLAASLWLVSACDQGHSSDPETPSTAPPTSSSVLVTPALSSTTPALTPTTSMEVGIEPTGPATGTPEPPPVAEHNPSEEICGVLLPHRLEDAAEPIRELPPLRPDAGPIPTEALPAWQRLVAAPETVGLAAFEVGREAEGVYLNADAPMPLASVVKIVHLIAYAEAVDAGQLNPGEWLPLAELERYYLPGSDTRSHPLAIEELTASYLVAYDPPATPLEQVPWMMIRHSSNAATDYLHMALGQQVIEQTVLDLGLTVHTAPCPFLGQFLVMGSRSRQGDDRSAVQDYIEHPDVYAQEVMRLVEAYADDEAFTALESSPRWQRPTLEVQALFSDNLNAQGTAGQYAALMARVLGNGLSSPYVNILVRRVLEWPMAFPANQALFSTVGYKNGSLPGVLTTAYYALRLEDGAGVVVVLFYRQLPEDTYRAWRRTLPHDELARWLLSEPGAIAVVRDLITGP